MKIALMSKEFINNDIKHNCDKIISSIKCLSGQVDLICFGEAYLQGFDALTWNYQLDKDIAITIDSRWINNLRVAAKTYKVAVSFGYLEIDEERIYCSYLFIGNNGNIVANYRRVSIGWKEYSKTDHHYCEGDSFSSFTYMNKRFVIALCGDLWYDENIEKIAKLEKDIILWPLYISYNFDVWKTEKNEYLIQVNKLNKPVLFINSICKEDTALGGCYMFSNDSITSSLELGNEGVLIVDV